jgi:excisionase family DNA binding protein
MQTDFENETHTGLPSRSACISIREIAEITGMGQGTIRTLIQTNVIPHIRVGRKILIPRDAFLDWWKSKAPGLRIPSKRR